MRTTDNFEHYDFLYDRFLDYCHEEYFKKYYDFLNEIQSQFSPTDRLIRIIEKIISFNTDIKYDKEIENVISPFMNDECSSQELPFPFTWLDQDSISSYKLNIIGVRDALNSSLCALLNEIRDRFSIDQYEHLMKNGISIINQNTELFTISPLLFPIGVWKKIVKYELSLFSIEQKEIEVKKMWYNIRDLKARIKYDYIFDSNLFAHEWDDKYKITYLGQANLCDFNIPTKSLTNYIENIKLEHIKYFHKESLIDEMNSIYKRSRIVLNSNYKQNEIIKFFNCLSKKHSLSIQPEHFLYTCTKYETKLLSHKLTFNKNYVATTKIEREDLEDFINSIKYLKQNNVIINSVKKNSNRKIASIIKNYIPDCPLDEESIRKMLSPKSKTRLPKAIQMELNYYLK